MRSTSSVLSRSQRRQASRQGLLTLLLLVVVAAASFLFGFAAGRWSAPAPVPLAAAPPPARIPVTRAPEPVAESAAAAVVPAVAAVTGAPAAPAPGGEALTYYDTLTKGEPPPLGSGINLPPPGTATVAAPPTPASKVPAAPAKPGPADKPAPAAGAAGAKAGARTEAGGKDADTGKPALSDGSYVVQTASFRKLEDAEALKKRLAKRGLTAFAEAVEVSGKGIWYRVMLGPYATSGDAEGAAAQVTGFERMHPVVKKR